MKLHIEHATTSSHAHPVREAVGEARLRPRDEGGQRVVSFELTLDPSTSYDEITDRFGNTVQCYSVLPPHERLVVTATSVVETSDDPLLPTQSLTLLEERDFTSPSQYVPLTGELRAFAETSAPNAATDTPEAIVTLAHALMGAIYTGFAYEPGSTDISTTADAVLVGRRGVCQDFAHLMIALCRSLHVPARYVSGYLYDPSKTPEDVLASHAWVEMFLPGEGWMGFDPTHNRATGKLYVRVAVGRDYADAAPIRGVFRGGDDETMTVQVRIRAEEQAPVQETL